MDIFITGDLSEIALSLVNRFLEEGHSVVVNSASEDLLAIKHRNFTTYEMTPSDGLYKEIFRSHTFDAVFYIAAHGKNLLNISSPESAHITNGLDRALSLSKQTSVKQFIFLSSFEVYGNIEIASEDTLPNPSTSSGQLILNGENLCRFYTDEHKLSVSIVRLPYIYGPNEKNSFLTTLIQEVKIYKEIKLNTSELAYCSFLHFDDLAAFLESVLEDEGKYGLRIFNLNNEVINFSFLAQQINFHLPDAKFIFDNKITVRSGEKKIKSKAAKVIYDWTPRHQLIDSLPDLIETETIKQAKRTILKEKIKSLAVSYRPFLVWGEVLLGAFLMHMLTIWTNTIIKFKYIDYRLLFVVIIGSTHGLLFGIISALLACVSSAFSWYRIGLDWAQLIYNVESWIPFAVFFLAGAVTGYARDKKENEINFERQQTELIHEKYEFLYSLYNEISTIKDRLREQLVGYRDSFGRFFRIASELNELEEDNIFLKALDVLEELMKNDQIAIYSIESSGNYGRLEVKSKNLTRPIPKSIKLSEFSEALDFLNKGHVFQNKDLKPGYPSYAAPISNRDQLIGLVLIWEAKFEQFNMYYFNLFKVITGLIESSLVRAATFKNAQTEKLFIPATQIMKPGPFSLSLATRKKMHRSKIADFQIMRINKGEESWKDLYERLSKGIRAEDIVGVLNVDDPHCYVILTNAGIENISIIQERIEGLRLSSTYIEDLEVE